MSNKVVTENAEEALASIGINVKKKKEEEPEEELIPQEDTTEAIDIEKEWSADDLLDAVTNIDAVEYYVSIPGKDQPYKVWIKPVSLASFFSIQKDYRLQADVASSTSAEAMEAVDWIISGTVKPKLDHKHMAKLLEGHPSVIIEWSMAIRRLSGDVPRVKWDERSQAIINGTANVICDLMDEGIVSVVKKHTKDKEFMDVMDVAIAEIKDLMKNTISECVAGAEQLGQDKFRNSKVPAKLGVEEVKND